MDHTTVHATYAPDRSLRPLQGLRCGTALLSKLDNLEDALWTFRRFRELSARAKARTRHTRSGSTVRRPCRSSYVLSLPSPSSSTRGTAGKSTARLRGCRASKGAPSLRFGRASTRPCPSNDGSGEEATARKHHSIVHCRIAKHVHGAKMLV